MMDPGVLNFMIFVNTAITFVNSVYGIITAVISLASFLFLVLLLLITKVRRVNTYLEKVPLVRRLVEKEVKPMAEVLKAIWQVTILAFLLLLGTGIIRLSASTEQLPPNVRLTNEAWKAYDEKKYERAIERAEECIRLFERDALPEQEQLERSNAPLPPVGSKLREEEKKAIFNQGLLNDVATCWLIKGLSLEGLRKIPEAITAYCKAAKYTYARTYDPSYDGFWSPSKKAQNSISYLKGKCE